jgi:prepilin-type N-terminal cleavage/methylation domain-containing protein
MKRRDWALAISVATGMTRRKGAGGFTLIEMLLVLVIIGVLLALLVPNFVVMSERARRSAVRNSMRVVQAALEAYSADNQGHLPPPWLSWRDDSTGIALWMPGGDPAAEPPQPGQMPLNPYTGLRYNSVDTITDLDYQTLYGRLAPGQAALIRGSDPGCPYFGFQQSPDWPGGIGIATCLSPSSDSGAYEYGIYGYGRSADRPMYNFIAGADGATDTTKWVFLVLHN